MRAWALVLVVLAGCYPQQIDPMKKQPKYQAYEGSRFFEDGRAMRPLVAGTVPRERRLGEVELTSGRDARGELVAKSPLNVDRAGLEAGRAKFDVWCAVCHGTLGDGDSVPAQKMSLRPPPSLHDFKDRPDGFFYEVIAKGFGFMPSYAGELTVEERWQVVAYVRALQLSREGRLEQVPPDVRRRLEKEKP